MNNTKKMHKITPTNNKLEVVKILDGIS